MKPNLLKMFFSFLKIGALLLGGGYVIVPLLKNELAEKNRWISDTEIIDYYALGQCIPGIIAVNTTLFIGYKLRGKTGALVAFLGLILPPFFAIILLANILIGMAQKPLAESIFWGVNVTIIILLVLTIKEVWKNSITDTFTMFLFLLILILAAFGASPSILIILAGILGILYKQKTKKETV